MGRALGLLGRALGRRSARSPLSLLDALLNDGAGAATRELRKRAFVDTLCWAEEEGTAKYVGGAANRILRWRQQGTGPTSSTCHAMPLPRWRAHTHPFHMFSFDELL